MMGPFKDEEDMARAACERMTSQPGAANGMYGFEYCALHYYSSEDHAFFLSYLSDMGGSRGGTKYCELPRALLDVEHQDVVILGGAHTHPHNRAFSDKDLSERAHWPPRRFVDPVTRRVWDRQLLMFFREKTQECRAYLYNNATHVVSALRAGEWVPIAKVYNDAGDIEFLDGRGWLP